MKNIITIQHTQSLHHTNSMIGAWTDWELTELGKRQADNIGKALKNEINNANYIMYSSDLKRTKQTAEIVSNHLNIEPIYRKELREINLGSATGKSVEWLRNNQLPISEKVSSLDYKCLPDAESKRQLYGRLTPFINEILSSENENKIIVSHGGTLSMLFSMWMFDCIDDLKHKEFYGLSGGVSILIENEIGDRIIKKMNDLSYMKSLIK
jgi:broad specificity phosphatase PhoE